MNTVVTDTHGAAARTGLAVATLEKRRLTGDGPPFVRLGRSIRYRVSDLDDWLASHIVSSTSEVKSQ